MGIFVSMAMLAFILTLFGTTFAEASWLFVNATTYDIDMCDDINIAAAGINE